MKSFARYLFTGLLLLTLTGVVALGKTKRELVTFDSDITVNGTVVKAGTYDLRFDEQTGSLEILKGSKVVATTATHVEKRDKKARGTEIHTISNGNVDQLVSVAFSGKEENIVVGPSSQSTTGQE
jgi:hypothetical protein